MQQYIPNETMVFNAKKEENYSYEFSLPEYLPSIARIIKTTIRTEKSQIITADDKAEVELGVKISVMYLSDFQGKIKNAVFRENIRMSLKELDENTRESVFVLSHHIFSSSSRPQSPRKISVSFSVFASVFAFKNLEIKSFSPNTDEGICSLTKKVSVCEKSVIPEQGFEFDTDLTLDSDKPPVAEVIFADAVFSDVTSVCRDDFLEISAKLVIHTLYENSLEDNSSSPSYQTVISEFPFTKTLDSSAFCKDSSNEIYIEVNTVEPSVSFDPYGENRVISFNTNYSIGVNTYKQAENEITTDAFSENYQSKANMTTLSYESLLGPISEKSTVTQEIKVDLKDMQNILDCLCKIQSVSFEQSEGKLFAAVKCRLEIFGTNSENELSITECTQLLHVPVPLPASKGTDLIPEIIVSIPNTKVYIKEGALFGEFDVAVNGVFLSKESENIVESLDQDTQKATNKDKSEIIIYYPPTDESLWSIAKKYAINPETIKKANKLETNSVKGKKMLIIP